MWLRNRSADVLLQGGVRAVIPYLKDIAGAAKTAETHRCI